MNKIVITYFFSFILMASVVTPSYFLLLDGTCEVAEMADLGEEEENKGNETAKDLDVKIYYPENSSFINSGLEEEKRINFYLKSYSSLSQKMTSPPPETTFLSSDLSKIIL